MMSLSVPRRGSSVARQARVVMLIRKQTKMPDVRQAWRQRSHSPPPQPYQTEHNTDAEAATIDSRAQRTGAAAKPHPAEQTSVAALCTRVLAEGKRESCVEEDKYQHTARQVAQCYHTSAQTHRQPHVAVATVIALTRCAARNHALAPRENTRAEWHGRTRARKVRRTFVMKARRQRVKCVALHRQCGAIFEIGKKTVRGREVTI